MGQIEGESLVGKMVKVLSETLSPNVCILSRAEEA
jgi:hypothetical protein